MLQVHFGGHTFLRLHVSRLHSCRAQLQLEISQCVHVCLPLKNLTKMLHEIKASLFGYMQKKLRINMCLGYSTTSVHVASLCTLVHST